MLLGQKSREVFSRSFLVFTLQSCGLFSSVFIQLRFYHRFHLAPFLGWTNVNAKPETEVHRSVFVQERNSVNGPLYFDCFLLILSPRLFS